MASSVRETVKVRLTRFYIPAGMNVIR